MIDGTMTRDKRRSGNQRLEVPIIARVGRHPS